MEYIWDRFLHRSCPRIEQAGTWDPLLQGLHLDKHLLEKQNTNKLWGTENNYMHEQLGQIMTTKYKKTKTQLPLLRVPGWKHGATPNSCTEHHQGRGQTTWASSPVQSTHLPYTHPMEKLVHTPWRVSKCTCFLFSSLCAAQHESQQSLAWTSHLTSYQFPLTERAHRLRWVIRCTTICGRGVEAIWCPLLGVWADTGQCVPTQEHQQHWRATGWRHSWLDPKTAPRRKRSCCIMHYIFYTTQRTKNT